MIAPCYSGNPNPNFISQLIDFSLYSYTFKAQVEDFFDDIVPVTKTMSSIISWCEWVLSVIGSSFSPS